MLFAYVTGKKSQDYIVRGFAKGANANVLPISNYLRHGLPTRCTGVIFAGMLRGNMLLFDECLSKGIVYYYLDHSYFKSGYVDPFWMRITKNGFVQNNIITADQSRWNAYFQTPVREYNFENKRKILVLPPSHAVQQTFGVETWKERTIQNLSRHTSRQIIVREKSGPIIDNNRIRITRWQHYNYPQPLDELWNDIYCVVTFNSSLGLDALIRGIPVITTKFGPAWPLSNRIENIENLIKYNRTPLLCSLSWGQYNYKEMISSSAFKLLNKFDQVAK